jgi:hypothetical protein
MGLMNTFFVASDDAEARTLASALGGPPHGFNVGGLTDIELDTLLETLTGTPYETIASTQTRQLLEEDEQWLTVVRPDLVAALTRLSSTAVDQVAATWVETDELRGVSAGDARDLITGLATVSRESVSTGRPLYFWTSL